MMRSALALPKRRGDAWRAVLGTSGVDGHDYSRADERYAAFLEKRGGDWPPPWKGGELDAVNEWLGLEGGRRVSGARQAFDLLTVGAKLWSDVLPALDLLRQVPGLESLRLPDEARDAICDQIAYWHKIAEMI